MFSGASALRVFAKEHFPSYYPANSNLLRKHEITIIDQISKRGESLQCLSKAGKHRPETILHNYVCEDPEDDARYGRIIFERAWGTPVAWPSDEIYEKYRRPLEEILAKSVSVSESKEEEAELDKREAEDEEAMAKEIEEDAIDADQELSLIHI